ncbi:hypothetical protein KDA_75420 [Dictyobacter alpinus]|uniref:ParB-like N-terminal domain-containing protein n=1 Tax=Dictyobacter alpinus TaxID=2014873 RepID=A0A402BL16_9CHLR|nr:ParB/RepB/Spo0J family partition protein [Dictyobacter alpinus]GCE32058.1 hypothetical protein KDA_75420 [Dictyobacter alpinus]
MAKQSGGAKTLQGLASLTSKINQGEVIGVSGSSSSSLYQVFLAPIDDILPSKYQTREAENPKRFESLVTSMKQTPPQEFKDALPVRHHPDQDGKLQVVRGGHTRLKAAKAAGLSQYPVILVEYDNKRSAFDTARENLAREDLTPVEEGRLYLIFKHEWGYTQEGLEAELGISRNRIKECMAAAQSHPLIIEMFTRIKEMESSAKRGLLAAKHLRRLEVLDERQPGLTARLLSPLIDAFLYEKLLTDALDIATKRIVASDDPEATLAALLRDLQQQEETGEQPELESVKKDVSKKETAIPEIQRSTKLHLATQRLRQFVSLIQDRSPSEEERTILTNMRNEIEAILQRA